jgi:tetratricopeptide (TPR) repeat protein
MKWAALLLSLLLFAHPAPAQDAADLRALMAGANRAYGEGDYATAINLYEILLAEGGEHAAVHFNLASAYQQVDDLPRALLHLHRAQRLAPRDVEIRVALERARLQTPTGGAGWTVFPANIVPLTESLATLDELATAALLLWAVWCFCLLGLLLDRARRDRWRVPTLMLTIPLLVALLLLGSRLYSAGQQPTVIVMQAGAALSGPGADFVPLFEMGAASEARLLEVRGEWGRLVLPGGRQGWLPLALIDRV